MKSEIQWINGMSQPDERGFVMLEGCEKVREEALASGDPVQVDWATTVLPKWFAIQSALDEPSFNLTEDQRYQVSVNIYHARLMCGHTHYSTKYSAWIAYRVGHHPRGGYLLIERYPDAGAFMGDNVMEGRPTWFGMHANDAEGFARSSLARVMHDAALEHHKFPFVAGEVV